MPIGTAQTGTVVFGNTNTLTFVYNAAPAENDFLLLIVCKDVPGTTFTWPTGFTQGDPSHSVSGLLTSSFDGQTVAWAWKIAGASETNSYTVVASASWNCMLGGIRYAGVNTSTPFDVAPTQLAGTSGASPLAVSATGVGTGSSGRKLVAMFSMDVSSPDASGIAYSGFPASPSTWTSRVDGSGINYANLDIWDAADSAGTYTSNVTSTATFTGSGLPLSFLIALRAATSGQIFYQSIAGALSCSGTLTKSISKPLAGAVSFAGTLVKRINLSKAGNISFSGALASIRLVIVSLSGSLVFTGSAVKSVGKSLAGALLFSGALNKLVAVLKAGTISFYGLLGKSISKQTAGVLWFSGYAVRMIHKIMTGSLSFIRQLDLYLTGPSVIRLAVKMKSTIIKLFNGDSKI